MKALEDYLIAAEESARRRIAQQQRFQQILEEDPVPDRTATPSSTFEHRRIERALSEIAERSWTGLFVPYLAEVARGLRRVLPLRGMLDQKEQELHDALRANRSALAAILRWHPGDPRVVILRAYRGQLNGFLVDLPRERAQLKHVTCDRLTAAATFYQESFRGRRVPSYRPLRIALGHELDRGLGVWPRSNFQELIGLADRQLKRGRSWPWTVWARRIVADRAAEPILKRP